MQDCQAVLNDSLQEFSHSFFVGSALEKEGSAKPPGTLQKQVQTGCRAGVAGCRVGIVCFSGGLKQLPLVLYLVMHSPGFLIVGVSFLGRGHHLWENSQVSQFR